MPMTLLARHALRSVGIWTSTVLHHNTHLSMPLKGIEFPDRDAIPRQI
jgi:hypothetical protein